MLTSDKSDSGISAPRNIVLWLKVFGHGSARRGLRSAVEYLASLPVEDLIKIQLVGGNKTRGEEELPDVFRESAAQDVPK